MPDLSTDMAKETLVRSRRIETRLTTLMLHMGVDARGERPEFVHGAPVPPGHAALGTVRAPSLDCSLKSILAAIPRKWVGDVQIRVGSDHVATLTIQPSGAT